VSFVVAMVAGLAGPLLAVTGVVTAHPPTGVQVVGVQVVGVGVALAGSAATPAALVAAVQLQVRAVEEPHLRATHGDAYAAYAARTGRFVPRIGRLPAPAPTGHPGV
jgi:hypothetical protein